MDQTHTAYQKAPETDNSLIGQIPLPIPEQETTVSLPSAEYSADKKIYTITPKQNNTVSPDETAFVQPVRQGVSRIILQVFTGIMAMLAVFVYGVTLLTEGGMVLSKGIGYIAVGELFGGLSMVSVQKVNPPLETESVSPPSNSTSDTPLVSLPANEGESDPGTVTNIRRYNLASQSPQGLGLINETPYSPDLDTLLTRTPIPSLAELQDEYGTEAPIVLILHTHGTEAFSDSGEEGYHTQDNSRNILSIGSLMADILEENKIPTIHCTTLFDADSFDSAYYNASLYIREILEKHPSISYIFDLHRDAIVDADNAGIAPYTENEGTGYAQMMFVVGTDHGGSGHTGWLENLSLAVRLQTTLHGEIPTLMRDINLRSASFNAQYSKGSLLIEAGAAASDMEDVKNSVRLLSEAIAKEIISPGEQVN